MPIFRDRRTVSFNELSGDVEIQRYNSFLNRWGFSGGHIPSRPDVRQQYPPDQTTSVVNMR